MLKKNLIIASGIEMDIIAGGGGYGWDEKWGQEVIFREILPNVKPGDKVIDLGGNCGRASISLTAKGAKVTIVDLDAESINHGKELLQNAGIKGRVSAVVADVRVVKRKDVGGGADVVIASDVLNHMSKDDANALIDRLPDLLQREKGGMVYVNAPSTLSGVFQFPEGYGARRVDEKTLELPCDCSGELKDELMPFFQPGEIESRLALKGARIVRVETINRGNESLLDEVVARFSPRKK